MYFDIVISGFGGQGILFTGNLLAIAAMNEGFRATYFPVYGVEMRGGTANCTVVVSDEEIGSPVVAHPHYVICMSRPSLAKYLPLVNPGGSLFVNSSLIEADLVTRSDLTAYFAPFNELATEAGDIRFANIVSLGFFLRNAKIPLSLDSVKKSFSYLLPAEKHKAIANNLKALEKGLGYS